MAGAYIRDVDDAKIDATCSMKYWFHNLENDVGMINKRTIIPDAILKETSQDIKAIASLDNLKPDTIQTGIDTVLDELTPKDRANTKMMELLYRRLGLMAAYALFFEGNMRKAFKVVETTPDLTINRESLWVMVHPTLLMKGNSGNYTAMGVQFMPNNTNIKYWLHNRKFDITPHLEMMALEEMFNIKVDTYQVIGMSAGYKSQLDHKLNHPYIYGYYHEDSGEWTGRYRSEEGWKKIPVWEYPHGIVEWVEKVCGESIAKEVIKIGNAFFCNKTIGEGWLAYRKNREREIAAFTSPSKSNLYLRQVHFERNTDNCIDTYTGDVCPYMIGCWGHDSRPLSQNEDFVRRIPLTQIS